MVAQLLAPESVFFTSALGLMLLVGLAEAIGLGASMIDIDIGADTGGVQWLDWLGVGRVPLLVVIVAFLACFGVIGLVGQQLADALLGDALLPLIAVPAALVAALPATGIVARGLARILPQDETTAYSLDGLTGLVGTISVGEARAGSPARASVRDPHGQRHNVLVEPVDPALGYAEGQEVILVQRQGEIFRVVAYHPPEWSLP
jgi:hypothetical protein